MWKTVGLVLSLIVNVGLLFTNIMIWRSGEVSDQRAREAQAAREALEDAVRANAMRFSAAILEDGRLQIKTAASEQFIPDQFRILPYFVERDNNESLGEEGTPIMMQVPLNARTIADNYTFITLPNVEIAVCSDFDNSHLCETMDISHYTISYSMFGNSDAQQVAPAT